MNNIAGDDVLHFLESLPEESADLIIADPPYGIEKSFGVEEAWQNIEEWALWCERWLGRAKRVLKPTGSILVYGIHNFICYNQISLYKLGMKYRRQFIWHYENGFCGHRIIPRATYEPLLWFSKNDDFYFAEIREPYKSTDRLRYKIVKNGKTWEPHPGGRIVGDVWAIPTLAGRRFRDEKVDHPSQKPMALSERLVRHFSPPNGHIVIPFAGSGSECVAAFINGRTFEATEINPSYQQLATRRLKEAGWNPTSYASSASGKKLEMLP
jgi:DNA modification methylase